MLPSIVYSSYKSSKKLFNEKNIPIQNTPNKEEKKCWFWNTPPSSMFLYACNLQMKKAKFVITNINADIKHQRHLILYVRYIPCAVFD